MYHLSIHTKKQIESGIHADKQVIHDQLLSLKSVGMTINTVF